MASSSDRCGRCGVRLVWARTGRPRRYCSTTCRVAAHRSRPVDQVLDDVDVVDQVLDDVPAAALRPVPPVLFRAPGDHS